MNDFSTQGRKGKLPSKFLSTKLNGREKMVVTLSKASIKFFFTTWVFEISGHEELLNCIVHAQTVHVVLNNSTEANETNLKSVAGSCDSQIHLLSNCKGSYSSRNFHFSTHAACLPQLFSDPFRGANRIRGVPIDIQSSF